MLEVLRIIDNDLEHLKFYLILMRIKNNNILKVWTKKYG